MEKLYTELSGTYVLPDPGDISDLKLDACLVGRRQRKLYIHALDRLSGKEVELDRNRWADPVFGYQREDGQATERFLVMDGERKDIRLCNLCKDRLNGITGNCFNYNVRPKGCAFKPAKPLGQFKISLDDWKKLRPLDVNRYSPFRKPWNAGYVTLDQKVIRRNRKARMIRSNFHDFLGRKKEKYCSRCISKGLCYMTSVKVADHCMVTEEKKFKGMLKKIQKRFGSVESFLNRLAYSGKEITHRPAKEKRRTRWMITKPVGRNHFLVRKVSRPWKMARVTRRKVEKNVVPGAIPEQDREKMAALAWFFFEKYCSRDRDAYRGYRGRAIRILSVQPISGGISVSYYPYGWHLNRRSQDLTSFNAVLRFEH